MYHTFFNQEYTLNDWRFFENTSFVVHITYGNPVFEAPINFEATFKFFRWIYEYLENILYVYCSFANLLNNMISIRI